MPPKRVQKSRSRQTTPQSPPTRSPSYHSTQQSRRSTRSRSHDQPQQLQVKGKQIEAPLEAVEEESASDDDIQVIRHNPPSDYDPAESTGYDQNVSENDIDDSDSSSDGATQLEALDADLITDSLPALYNAASQILELFKSLSTPELMRELRLSTSKSSKRLQNFVRNFDTVRDVYGSGAYIDATLVARKLIEGSELNDGPWRPDAVLQLANLSSLLVNLSHNDNTVLQDALERMFNTFPEPFGNFHIMIGDARYGTRFIDETVSFGISLRTQFFLGYVGRFRGQPSFDPDSALRGVFLDEDENLNGFLFGGDDILPEVESAINERVESIRAFFKKSSRNPIDLTGLNKKFPSQEFITEAIRWAALRKQELDDQIQAQGGIGAIKSKLESGNFEAYAEVTPYVRPTPELGQAEQATTLHTAPSPQRGTPAGRQSRTSGASTLVKRAARLKEIQAQEEDSSSESSASSDEVSQSAMQQKTPTKSPLNRLRTVVSEIPQSPDVGVGNDADNGSPELVNDRGKLQQWPRRKSPPTASQRSIVPTAQTLAVLEVAREQAILGNKENIDTSKRSYLDKQASAKRLDWNETQSSQKRSHDEIGDEDDEGEDEIEDEEDDDFETDTRPSKRSRQVHATVTEPTDDYAPINGDDDEEDLGEEEDDEQEESEVETTPPPQSQPLRSTNTTPRQLPSSTQPLPHRSPLQPRVSNTTNSIPSSSAPQLRTIPTPRQQAASTTRSASTSVEPTAAQTYAQVNAQARATMRLRPIIDPTFTATRPAQIRRPWTIQETNRLFEMIGIHGCQWAEILKEDATHAEGPALQQRTQVQLKDKARNLKMDYLKAGAGLPDGFQGVTIKSSDKELLAGMGLPYA